ncbi:profilin, required for normal timing of actin polymerization in response to thermal stress [Quaeritorhiza haematococci]|nr:profilin, required for normal timing of actin polymerization in response to thermal stress [Quaeritorhiza haematococci]
MSWQSYVDSNLVGTGKIAKAAIHGLDGTAWATSAGFSAFTDASDIRANGLHLAGVKYFTLRADDRSVYAKKGTGGVACVKTKQAILIGVYQEPTQPPEANKVVEGLADYLISVNY